MIWSNDQCRFYRFSVGGLAFASCHAAMAQSSICQIFPDSDKITIWSGSNFNGACKTLGIRFYFNLVVLYPVTNDSISSLRVGGDVRAHLYKMTAVFTVGQENFRRSVSSLTLDRIGLIHDVPLGIVRLRPIPTARRATTTSKM
jgi:hypothetical protein